MTSTLAPLRMSALVAVVALVVLQTPLVAQSNDHSAEMQHRNDCRLAAQVFRSGHPHPKYEWARLQITSCRDEGPDVLAEEWRTTRGDTAQLRYLVFNTGRMRDARLFEQLRDAVGDRSRANAVRIAAMLSLAKYVDPYSALSFSDVSLPAGPVHRIPLVSAWSTNGAYATGTRPITGPVATTVLALLEQVAAQEVTENRAVWYAASVVARRVKSDVALGRNE